MDERDDKSSRLCSMMAKVKEVTHLRGIALSTISPMRDS